MNAAVNWQAFGLVVNAHMVHRRRTPTALARRAGVTEGVVLRAAAQLRIKQETWPGLPASAASPFRIPAKERGRRWMTIRAGRMNSTGLHSVARFDVPRPPKLTHRAAAKRYGGPRPAGTGPAQASASRSAIACFSVALSASTRSISCRRIQRRAAMFHGKHKLKHECFQVFSHGRETFS